MEVYLDNNATTQPLPEVLDAVAKAMTDGYGNPSSSHAKGARAKAALFGSKTSVAGLAGGNPGGLVLTSGGTEANNLGFSSLFRRLQSPRVAVSAAEHPSVLRPAASASGGRLTVLPLRRDGIVDLDALSERLEEGLDIVSVQWASGETGVVQPIREIARLCRAKGAVFHSDAAQAFGRVPLGLDDSGIDLVTLSAHKMHGPLGIGALWTRNVGLLSPAILGGGQQDGLRSGTENVPGAAGFAAACSARASRFGNDVARMTELRDRFERVVLAAVPDSKVNGASAERLCNTSSIRFKGVDGQAVVANLDRAGIMCSQTSACSSGRPEPSPTLLAMGLSEAEAWATVRFSFSVMNADQDADTAAMAVAEVVEKLRRFMVLP
ncbi:cysteine desulfurase [Azospirillum sp. RWY-5-1]|uniref:Cysteine desulfurase n=1 Tax=Azospirillum oleiclasticum TaxID=2735135 RepID=A0ABX2THQ3_9PROT|nr:cysteine desulfurase family protein [Azospirillum oleiclasticum]NYZ14809.1 cysteine desulfurase [Azospirillum oleiclasticum]NYZ22205.1 cysteine desulfurase [Azospirillum oleiclasticum]